MRHTRNRTALLMALSMLINSTVFPHAADHAQSDDPLRWETALEAPAEADETYSEGEAGREADGGTDGIEAPLADVDIALMPDSPPSPDIDVEAKAHSEGPLFTLTGPDGTMITWGEGDVGAATVYYDGHYDPEQRLSVASAQAWTLHDPEGVLQEVSSGGGETVYAMVRPSWEQPCVLTAGDTVLPLYVLFPANFTAEFILYDPMVSWPPDIVDLGEEHLQLGEAVRVAVICDIPREGTRLLTNPLDILHIDGPILAFGDEGAPYFTLVPEGVGQVTMGLQRGHRQTLWAAAGEPVIFKVSIDNGITIQDGQELRGTTRGSVSVGTGYGGSKLQGAAPLVRSSAPDVVAVEVDESDNSYYYLKPVGFGEAVIYIDSDQYHGSVRVVVADWPVPLEVNHTGQSDPSHGGGANLPVILPASDFVGTGDHPFVLPTASVVRVASQKSTRYLWTDHRVGHRFASSDDTIVRITLAEDDQAYLEPVSPGLCTITYREGPFVREVVVRSEPNSLGEADFGGPGFYTYYGSAHVHRDQVDLQGGQSIVMGVVPQVENWELEQLDHANFSFSKPGIARVEPYGDDLFTLIPEGEGDTVLTYTAHSGRTFQLRISAGMPDALYDFVLRDSEAHSGYRLWQNQQALVGESTEQEVYFARVTLTADGVVQSAHLTDFPLDLQVQDTKGGNFDLIRRGNTWYVCAGPRTAGTYRLNITATTPDNTFQTWEKRLFVSEAIVVSQNTVAAINEAIRTAPVADGYETVILLPEGYIPMDYDTPVLLSRPVTLRGQNTVLASDIAVLSHRPGAKLQDLTVRFDNASYLRLGSRIIYPHATGRLPPGIPILIPLNSAERAIFGDGIATIENCVLDGGTGKQQGTHGIAVTGDGVTFRGTNTVINFRGVALYLESAPGLRRYMENLHIMGNGVGIQVVQKGSTDPYFVRLTESNFMGNNINVYSPFPVNFSHNYFEGGSDDKHVTKSPQYTQRLKMDGSQTTYPNLFIEADRLASAELINFEGQAPIDTTNFTAADTVRIAVKELDPAGVGATDGSDTTLTWHFTPAPQAQATLFRPDAAIDEAFHLPANSGIETYQGVSFAHHGPLPMEGASISVQKRVLFEEDTLYLYRLTDGTLTRLGAIDNRADDDFYTFFLDGCSDYIITNVSVESVGGGSAGNGGRRPSGGSDSTAATGPSAPLGERQIGADDTPSSAGSTSYAAGPAHSEYSVQASGEPGVPTLYDFSHIPPPATMNAARNRYANTYVDDMTIREAFASPREGQVVLDVSVKTVISGLAFQLLAEHPHLTLVLKGDGYEWRFPGECLPSDSAFEPFDTAVYWRAEGSLCQLTFAQQTALPGNCTLGMEANLIPQAWALFDEAQGHYEPYPFEVLQARNRLTLELNRLGAYVGVFL